VFRYGGDEFLFALAVKSPKEAATFFSELKAGLEAIPLKTGEGKKVTLSCCIGYALFKGSYTVFSPALKMANEAIRADKKIGRSHIVSAAN
jgi:diguanylate cyclase (GGDEF)-like protein